MQWDYGFDFGAESVRCVFAGTGDMYIESACAAFRGNEESPFACGDRAYPYWGRETAGVRLAVCFDAGRARDIPLTADWMCRVMDMTDRRVLRRRRALAAVSPLMSDSEAELLERECVNAGMDACGTVHADMAAALGADIDVPGGESAFLLDVGASQIGWYVLSGARRVSASSLPFGLSSAEAVITDMVRQKEGLIIGPRAARLMKHSAFSAEDGEVEVAVFDPVKRLPRTEKLGTEPAARAVGTVINAALTLTEAGISSLPTGLAQDIQEKGITLVGGGANLYGLDGWLSEELKLPVNSVANPENCVAAGLKRYIDDPDRCACLLRDWRKAGDK